MIVTEDHMHAAVAVIGDYARAARTLRNVVKTKNNAKTVYSRLLLSFSGRGTNPEKEAMATCHPDYMKAKDEECDALVEREGYEAQLADAKNLIDIWREENWIARAAERIR